MTVDVLPLGLGPLLGWCLACHGAGRFVPAVDAGLRACQAHLRLLPRRGVSAGQLVLDVVVGVVPAALGAGHAAGEQQPCTDCVAAGMPWPRQGLSGRTPGDLMPLCLPCWRSRTDRARRSDGRRGLSAEESGWLAELAEQLACEVCGPKAPPVPREELLPPGAVAAKRRWRRLDKARGQQPRSPRRSGCWRCEDTVWLQAAREVHEADQAAAAADAARVDELRVEHRAAVQRVERARRQLRTLTAWHERTAGVLKAMPRLVKTGSRGRLQVKQGAGARSRPWAFLAEFLARDAAERQERGLSSRGRPSKLPQVVAVMAIAASFESGRDSMAGLHWTAAFAGVGKRTVTTGWARTVQLGVTRRVRRGRILTLAERETLGRHRERAAYDFTALYRSPVDRRPYLGAAALVLAQVLERAVQLGDEHQGLVDDAVAEAAAVQAELLDAQAFAAEQSARDLALQAEVDPASWAEQALDAARTARQVRGKAIRAARPPVDVAERTAVGRAHRAAQQEAAQAVDNAVEQASRISTFCDQPRRGPGASFSSGYLFWGSTSAKSTSPVAGGRRPDGRGADQRLIGASRSPTKSVTRPTASQLPRTLNRVRLVSPARPSRSETMSWAKPLARGLAARWEFLQRYLNDAADGRRDERAVAWERGLRVAKIATTLGARLGRDWRANDVVRLVERFAGIHSVIASGDAHSPLRYLGVMLDRALTNPAAQVPHRSPVRAVFEREVLAAELAAEAARAGALREELAAIDTAAAATRAGAQHGLEVLHAEMARIATNRAATSTPGRRTSDPDNARMAQARAELAQRHGARANAEVPTEAWPAVRQPGSGLP